MFPSNEIKNLAKLKIVRMYNNFISNIQKIFSVSTKLKLLRQNYANSNDQVNLKSFDELSRNLVEFYYFFFKNHIEWLEEHIASISDKNEILSMYFQKELSQLSTIEYDQAKKVFQGPIKEKKIQAITLNKILEISKIEKKIDLLDIDVEGADLKVLQSLSLDKFKPELICIEIHDENFKESKTYKFLDSCNYELIWSGVFSFIFKSR